MMLEEVVAAQIGSRITTSLAHIRAALELGIPIHRFIFRPEMELMAAFDLGPQWEALAKAPTLFLMSRDGKQFAKVPTE